MIKRSMTFYRLKKMTPVVNASTCDTLVTMYSLHDLCLYHIKGAMSEVHNLHLLYIK